VSPHLKIHAPSPAALSPQVGELAEMRLRESPYFFLRSLSCDFHAGVLTVRGQVPMSELRQLAENIVWRIDGVEDVINRVEVVDPMLSSNGDRAARSAG
jgi:hypothetical protein